VWYFARKLEKSKIKKMWNEFPLKTFVFIFFITLLAAFVISFFQSSISNFVISVRYSMFGFFLFLLFYIISYLFFEDKSTKLIEWYNKIIKWVLV
jgi:multidrug transporter EmrE-like cation transporter